MDEKLLNFINIDNEDIRKIKLDFEKKYSENNKNKINKKKTKNIRNNILYKEDLLDVALLKQKNLGKKILTNVDLMESHEINNIKKVSKLKKKLECEYVEEKMRNGFPLKSSLKNEYLEKRIKYQKRAQNLLKKVKKIDKRYDFLEGLILSFDYLRKIPKKYSNCYLKIQLYQNGIELKQNIEHLIFKNYLFEKKNQKMFYIQIQISKIIRGLRNKRNFFLLPKNNKNITDECLEKKTFLFFRLYLDEKFYRQKANEFKIVENVPDDLPPPKSYKENILYGWSVFEIFKEDILCVGKWRIPFFRPPVPKDFLIYNINELCKKLKMFEIFIRIDFGGENATQKLLDFQNLNFENISLYNIPDYLQTGDGQSVIDEYEEKRIDFKKKRNQEFKNAKHKKKIKKYLFDRKNDLINKIRINEKFKRQKLLTKLEDELLKKNDEERKVFFLEKTELEKAYENLTLDALNKIKEKKQEEEFKNRLSLHRRGLKIEFTALKKISTYDMVKIVFGIFLKDIQQTDDLGLKCLYKTENFVDHIPDRDLKNGKIRKLNISLKDQIWEIVKNLEGLAFLNKKKKVYLGIQVMTIKQEEGKLEVEDKEDEKKDENEELYRKMLKEQKVLTGLQNMKLYGWVMFRLIKKNGKMRTGHFIEFLKKPPFYGPPYKKSQKFKELKTSISFSLHGFKYNRDSLPYFWEKLKVKPKKGFKFKKIKNLNYIKNNNPFIINRKNQFKDKDFYKGSGIDIYVDSARFLPDNVGPTKILLRVIDNNLNDLFKIYQAGISDLSSDIFNPKFNFRHELRAPNFDPTLLFIIYIITIDNKIIEEQNLTGEKIKSAVRIVGFSILNLFINRNTLKMPENNTDFTSTILNNGYHQLPIYCEPFPNEKPFTFKILKNLDRLPCSSILIRIYESPKTEDGLKVLTIKDIPSKNWEKYGVWQKDVPYNSGLYNNKLIEARQSEIELFNFRVKKNKKSGREYLNELKDKWDIDLKSDRSRDDQSDNEDDFLIEIQDYYVNLSMFENINDVPILNIKYFSFYNPNVGLKFSVDVLVNPPKKGFYIIIYRILFSEKDGKVDKDYSGNENDDLDGLNAISQINWDNSTNQLIIFDEGFVKFSNLKFSEKTIFLIEIKKVKIDVIKEESVENIGWSFLPIFLAENYVNSMIYQLPIFKGNVSRKNLENFSKQDDMNDYYKTFIKKFPKKNIFPNTYLLCKLLDAQREGNFQKQIDIRRTNNLMLPDYMKNSNVLNESTLKQLNSNAKLVLKIPFQEDSSVFNKKLATFAEKLISNN